VVIEALRESAEDLLTAELALARGVALALQGGRNSMVATKNVYDPQTAVAASGQRGEAEGVLPEVTPGDWRAQPC